MGFFKKITEPIKKVGKKISDPITKASELDYVISENKRTRDWLESMCAKVNYKSPARLYEARKNSVKAIQNLQDYLNKLKNCPDVLKAGCARALSYTGSIQEASKWESQQIRSNYPQTSKKGNGPAAIGVTGTVAGGLAATLGPSAAMAIATTFGTASTGAAISALGGAAATNAALAWLGGGAMAAGGAGIAGGSALLGSLGPIGWSIAGASIIASTAITRNKNSKAISDLKNNTEEMKKNIARLSDWDFHMNQLIDMTNLNNRKISVTSLESFPMDFEAETFPKKRLFEMVSHAKFLGKLSKEAIIMS